MWSSGWRLAAVEASYAGFFARAHCKATSEERARGEKPDAARLLEAARKICGRKVDLIAVDMPMARHPIVGRRPCDNQISSKFGAAGAGVHSPNENRPGRISDALRAAFEAEGYALRTMRDDPSLLAHGLVEVYPHAALIRFFGVTRRLEYKAGKTQAINAIKGQVMKLSKGKANPAVVDQILAKKLAGQGLN